MGKAEERQMAYDIQTTTDDHGMHITGIVQIKIIVNILLLKFGRW